MQCRFASSGTVATSRSASRAILALNAASNFLRDLVISVLRRLRQSRTLHTLTFGPISGVHFKRLLQREQRIDFDDQKLRALKSLEASPNVSSLIQRQFDEVIVDEFQDINELDFNFVSLIAQKARLITGDDDQAIYGFRGCTPRYIIELEKHIGRDVESFELKRNYRCPRK